ncbi:MAG: helix-turn-helix domain-containing protein [Bacteroidota bacterium]|nr:helix-turn-helix domain-containing protein [Rhodothermia bacterium]MCS7155708.1 helix-turn-helix domain-containing protein [Bacteroidota bacterium]MDW8138780.1 helix-turn-helix domain-containing protein [Bacteroidota bacterium]MDW8285735.1 helix-turn-helix domain-containing protein [Bacteroidota bacterium]
MSTVEVAQLLGVTETTIKRWADAQRIPCIRTPGGHRKFRPEDVLAFAQAHGYPIEQLLTRRPRIRFPRSWDQLREWLYRQLLWGNADAVREQLYSWYSSGLELAALYDELISPVLERIGQEWASGSLSVAQEHLASNTLSEALQGFRQLTRPASAGLRRAVCAALEQEEHTLGLLMAAHLLELAGFQVDFLGARTPVRDLIGWLSEHKPQLLCLAFVIPLEPERAHRVLRSISLQAQRLGVRVLAGGRSADPAWVALQLVDGVYKRLRELQDAVKSG